MGLEGLEKLSSALDTFRLANGSKIQIQLHETADFVIFGIINQIEQLIQNEIVMLVADDILYESPLAEMAGNGLEITAIMFTERDGNQMMAPGRWGDVTIPLALSLGLKQNEL